MIAYLIMMCMENRWKKCIYVYVDNELMYCLGACMLVIYEIIPNLTPINIM